ncbi:hypothetical protein RHS02_03165, partial [Rhizoctonia solani]
MTPSVPKRIRHLEDGGEKAEELHPCYRAGERKKRLVFGSVPDRTLGGSGLTGSRLEANSEQTAHRRSRSLVSVLRLICSRASLRSFQPNSAVMRFLSIAALAGLVTTSVYAHTIDIRDSQSSRLEERTFWCDAGKAWINGRCQDCSSGSFSIGGYNSQCKACPAGSTSSTCESYCVCKPGFYLNGGKTTNNACNACAPGYSSGTGASGCSPCPSNTYSTGGSTCQACPAGYTSNPASGSCQAKCQAGTYLNNGQCRPCSAGSYSEPGAASCTTCPAGTFSNINGAGSCQTCPAGTTSNAGATSCKPVNCPAGKYSKNGSCENCPAGSYSGPNASSCSQCPANTFSTGGSSSCSACPNGASSLPGSSQCSTNCRAGQYWSGSKCNTCPAGFYSQAGASECSDCPDDTYSSAGAGSCTQCPTGKGCGSRSTSINQCIDKCPDGKVYSNGRCQNCPAGTYSNNNMCSDCPAGTISNSGSNKCTPCPGGSVPSPNGQTCTTCPRNTFSNGDNCSPCPAGSTSNPGSSSCGPQPSRRAQPVLGLSCASGQQRCKINAGRGGYECINTLFTLDACGGCPPIEGEESDGPSGRDCSEIPNVDQVRCIEGSCEIKSCRSGYEPQDGYCVEKAAYTGKNTTAHTSRAKRTIFSRHDTF